MKTVAGKILFAVLSVLYPILVFCGLRFWGLSPRKLSILLLLLAAFHLISASRKKQSGAVSRLKEGCFVAFLLACGVAAFALDNAVVLKFYPVLVNVGMLFFFGATLFRKPSFVFRLATFADKRILQTADRSSVERYCDRVTLAWCIFFILNGSVALWTVLWADEKIWSLYNGLISYILMGILFVAEIGIRKMKQSQLQSYIPFSQIEADSRPDDSVVCFSGAGLSSDVKTWADFKADVSKVRQAVEEEPYTAWILNADDVYHFLVAIFALFQSGKKILFTANRQPEFIREIRKPDVGFLNDTGAEGALQIPKIIETYPAKNTWKTFDIHQAKAAMYTSGTTGIPKEIPKEGSQYENEANALAERFAAGFANRNFYMTVNHHHIYGMAFSIFVPISAGLPIRRVRFEFPEELEQIVKEPAVIVASPAFLKRLAANRKEPLPFKKPPFWLSAGGLLPDDVANRVEELSGNGVQEIYGCTEAGAIATRRIREKKLWTPVPPNKISFAENGCLKIDSSYTDVGGFVTGDLGKIEPDGTFELLGRADSIVKIEEKRISLPEVENRLRQTGIVRDVRVVPMTGKRQFLAAAIVLNDEGVAKFQGVEKKDMNAFFKQHLSGFLENTVQPKKWRYLEELPQDAMGKIKTREVQALFEIPESPNFKILKYHLEGNKLTVKTVIPATSDYYDGHFPEFKLLPAVVQIDLILRFFRGFMKLPTTIEKMQRIKFSNPIFPEHPVTIEETYSPDTGKLVFKITGEDDKNCSGGTIVLKKENA